MKIRCPNCGSQINSNSKFCENCGIPIKRKDFPKKNKQKNMNSSKIKKQNVMSQDKVRCPECGLRQDPRVGYCKRCGTSLKSLPLEFPEDNSHKHHQDERPPQSMPRPNINKTSHRESNPTTKFDDDYRVSDKYMRQEIYNCPSCGVRLPSKDTVCPRCGYGQVSTVKSKSPILAALLSALIMGLGQVYTRQLGKGILLFLIGVICIFLFWLIIPLFFGFSFYIYGIIDAYEVANKITE